MSSSISVYLTMGNWYPPAGATSVSAIPQLQFLEWEDFLLLLCEVQTKLVGVYRYCREGGERAREGVSRRWKIIWLGIEDDFSIPRYLADRLTGSVAYLDVMQRVSLESGRQWLRMMGWIILAFLLSTNLLACKVMPFFQENKIESKPSQCIRKHRKNCEYCPVSQLIVRLIVMNSDSQLSAL